MTTQFRKSRTSARASVLGTACVLLLSACGGAHEPPTDAQGGPALGDVQLQLERAEDCDDLLTRIQDSIVAQLSVRAKQLKSGEEAYFGGPGIPTGSPEIEPPRAVEDADDGAVPSAPSGNSGGDAADPIAPSPTPGAGGSGGGFSGTTVQVKDVDEADIVKTDGDRIYLLHGGTLFVLAGWPANATELLGSALVEGSPAEMFVKDGKAVVFSRVYGDLAREGAAADPYGYYGYASYTKLSVFDVSGTQPTLLRESFIEGDYNSSRRHDDVVRAVVQDGFKIPQLGTPSIEYRDGFGQPYPQADIDAQVDSWLERTARSIRGTELGDWLPRELARQNGSLVAVAPRCADYYSPDPGLTQTGVTSVVSLDLGDVAAPLGGATILGNAERVYSNEDVVLITQTDYRYSLDAEATQQTIIHRFDIAGGSTSYTASGAVAGHIHDQFSLDERDGIIRVSSTEQAAWGRGGGFAGNIGVGGADPAPAVDLPVGPVEEPGTSVGAPAMTAPPPDGDAIAPAPEPPLPPERPSSVSRVSTLRTNGNALELLGSTEDFGETEQIFSTRFIGDRGYVVTFRQTDPLFVIDLADPADPRVVGELHVPGFSNYLFPLDEEHLFAIGRDATDQGLVQGLALQIFDVSDPTTPTLSHRYVFPDQGDSPANVDHRAVSFHPERGIVAFPHQSYVTGESTLEVFELSSDTGFARLGGMGMSDEIQIDECLSNYYGVDPGPELEQMRAQLENDPTWQREILASCRYGHVFKRGLFRDDFVYGVSNTGIYVYDLGAMEAGAVSELRLPAEVYDQRDYGGGTPPSRGGASPGIEIVPPPAAATPPASGAGGAASSDAAK
jgi:hypothetical protein